LNWCASILAGAGESHAGQLGMACPKMGFHGISWVKMGSQAKLKKLNRIKWFILFFYIIHVLRYLNSHAQDFVDREP
jgi:hypothetical protein